MKYKEIQKEESRIYLETLVRLLNKDKPMLQAQEFAKYSVNEYLNKLEEEMKK